MLGPSVPSCIKTLIFICFCHFEALLGELHGSSASQGDLIVLFIQHWGSAWPYYFPLQLHHTLLCYKDAKCSCDLVPWPSSLGGSGHLSQWT